eukprot:TRINITY_DN9400_c0_g1_i1.p1 TRINITY_DN9400_c0_g1~~TRINITY_DN9400_c0_g1_i1.p1  ORF type:complete len:207 (+),score=14.18 TRINITY_DN9400_c0_g1_i1:86-622(+)
MVEMGADWDRKNRLKVYEGLFFMTNRKFLAAANLFLDTLSSFSCSELFEYEQFIFYAVLTCIVSLPRVDLKKKTIDAPEILTVISKMPHLKSLLNSFYGCNYKEFFVALANVTQTIKKDRYIGPHSSYFCREMRIKAYAQLLESYKSVTLTSMAQAFGVSIDFLDQFVLILNLFLTQQ